MVKRLHLSLSQTNQLNKFQSGFRPNRSTLDSLVFLSQAIRYGYFRKQYTVSVFFDLEKAFDRIRSSSILQALSNMGFDGNLFCFIRNFLQNRVFQVRIGHTLSPLTPQLTGTPQGSVLSPLLFILAVNEIQNCISYPIQHLMYADDLGIFTRGTDIHTLNRQLQSTIDKLAAWGKLHGLSFAPAKTKVINFTRKRNPPNLQLTLNGISLPQDTSTKFLGLTFDHTLTWKPHMLDLGRKCSLRLNLLKTLSGTAWGADKKCLLRLYYSHIRSVLDYGSIVYASASTSTLKYLDPIQNQSLGIAIGAFRTCPIASILVETNSIPLTNRRRMNILTYYGKLLFEPSNLNSYRILSTNPPIGLGSSITKLCQTYNITKEQLEEKPVVKPRLCLVQEAIHNYLQDSWIADSHPYLFRTIKPTLEDWKTSYNFSRQKERVLARIRIGHTRLTHLYLILRTEQPHCDACNSPLTVIHVLNECSKYTSFRSSIYGSPFYKVYDSLTDNRDRIKQFFCFLKATSLYNLI